jgi:hypothetical protein
MAQARILQIVFLALLAGGFGAPPAHAYRIDQDKEGQFYQHLTPEERQELNDRLKDRALRRDNLLHHRRDKIKTRAERLAAWRQHEKDVKNRKMRKKMEDIIQRQREAESKLGKDMNDEKAAALTGAGPKVGRNMLESPPPGPPAAEPEAGALIPQTAGATAAEIAPPHGKSGK